MLVKRGLDLVVIRKECSRIADAYRIMPVFLTILRNGHENAASSVAGDRRAQPHIGSLDKRRTGDEQRCENDREADLKPSRLEALYRRKKPTRIAVAMAIPIRPGSRSSKMLTGQ